MYRWVLYYTFSFFSEESRIINPVSKTIFLKSTTGLLLSIICTNSRVASSPIPKAGCVTTVIGGSNKSATLLLVNHTKPISFIGFIVFNILKQTVVIRPIFLFSTHCEAQSLTV